MIRRLVLSFAFAAGGLSVLAPAAADAQEPPPLIAEWPICDVAPGGKLAWHPDGYIVLASFSQKIAVFGLDGSLVRTWGSSGAGIGQFTGLSGVAVGDGGTVFTSEEYGRRLQRFTIAGEPIGAWATGFYPPDIGADGVGHFYIATAGDDDIVKYRVDGTEVDSWSCHPCWAVTADPQGHVYGATDHGIEKFTSSGQRLWYASVEIDGENWDAQPNVVAVGPSGRVYVLNPSYGHTLVFSSEGELLRWWPGHGGGLAEDAAGRLYVSTGCTIRVYDMDSATPARPATWGAVKQRYR